MADMNVSKPRINASMLAKYQGKMVTLMGTAVETDQDGMGFTVKSPDAHNVHIKLNEQLQDYVEGLVEVQGVPEGGNMNCLSFVQFSPEVSNNFDMDSYDKAVSLINQNSQFYFQRDGFPQTS